MIHQSLHEQYSNNNDTSQQIGIGVYKMSLQMKQIIFRDFYHTMFCCIILFMLERLSVVHSCVSLAQHPLSK